jgi:hypothetical protein
MRSTDYKEHNKNRENAELCAMDIPKARLPQHLVFGAAT